MDKEKEIILTDSQNGAVSSALRYLNSEYEDEKVKAKRFFVIGGGAGTGKTTVQRFIQQQYNATLNIKGCAFTGRAALRMRQKGVENASTIHSTIYSYNEELDEFVLKNKTQLVDKEKISAFMVDEFSMVSFSLWADLLSFSLPIIGVGDHFQLEPVGDDPQLMKNLDFELTEIHRQVAESPIIKLSLSLRDKNASSNYTRVAGIGIYKTNKWRIAASKLFYDGAKLDEQVVLCATNKLRVATNAKMRTELFLDTNNSKRLLTVGDRVVILQNNRTIGVYNGQLFTVAAIFTSTLGDDFLNVDLIDDDGVEYKEIDIWKKCIGVAKPPKFDFKQYLSSSSFSSSSYNKYKELKRVVLLDYGYAITVHKAQGSEWKYVTVLDEWWPNIPWDIRRWRYTAVTRASERLTIYT